MTSGALVTTAVAVGLAVAVAAQKPRPAFEVVSVKPQRDARSIAQPFPQIQPGGGFTAARTTVQTLVQFAYDLQPYEIAGGPGWIRQSQFEVNAKAGREATAEQIKLMVHSLLADRFQLVSRVEPRDMRYQALVAVRPGGPSGPGLVSIPDCSPQVVSDLQRTFPDRYPIGGAGTTVVCASGGLAALAAVLSTTEGPVIDTTGLKGNVYIALRSQWSLAGAMRRRQLDPDPDLPALSTALEEQLGVKLESRRGPINVLVIGTVELPTPD